MICGPVQSRCVLSRLITPGWKRERDLTGEAVTPGMQRRSEFQKVCGLLCEPLRNIAAMKWATLIFFFLFATAVDSRHLQKRSHDSNFDELGEMKKAVGTEVFENVVLALLAQTLQKCSLEQHLKILPDVVKVAQHCEDHPQEEKCKRSPNYLFYDVVCEHKHLEACYPWISECCAKEDEEEHKCFVKNRPVEVEPYEIPDIEWVCKQQQEDPNRAYKYFIVELARRHGKLYTPTALLLAKEYHTGTTECCAAEDKAKCFSERMPQIKKSTDYIAAHQRYVCNILDRFPERVTQEKVLVKISQVYPRAEFQDVHKIAQETADVIKDCCHECVIGNLNLIEHSCAAKDKLSRRLAACCEMPIVELSACIYDLPIEDPPADVPSLLPKFVESDHVCKDYEADKNGFMDEFMNTFARNHTHSHPLFILRVAEGYKGFIRRCCAGDNPPECYKTVPKILEASVELRNAIAKDNCEALQKLGPRDYNLQVLYRYTQKMPQVTDNMLIDMAGKMTSIAARCCAGPHDQIQYCSEELLDMLMGEMCEREANTFINNNVRECCTHSYPNRRSCFAELGPDPQYVLPALDEKDFLIGEEVCKGIKEEQEHHIQEFFVDVIKQKLDIGKDKLEAIVDHFRTIQVKCCADPDPKQCMATESPSLLTEVKAALAH